ncbi:MAG: sporulation transcription factor Spo0A [Burkholderiales bacterium]|jgi:two-component system response regulator (stage 0 sporulation protein A)
MEKKIKLMIIEDNVQLNEMLTKYFSTKSDVEVVGSCTNPVEAAGMIKEVAPDALIIDMIMPEADGLSLLERFNTSEFETMPATIVVSAVGNEKMVKMACDLGAKYYMIKPVNKDILYRRIQDMFGHRVVVAKKAPAPIRSRTLDEKITAVFLSIGIPAHIKGYHFLREAIKMVVKQPELINSITKKLYPGIAEPFETSPSKVERAIRHAIEVAWSRGKIENINQFLGYNIYTNNDKPTNGEFIALMADKLIMDRSA